MTVAKQKAMPLLTGEYWRLPRLSANKREYLHVGFRGPRQKEGWAEACICSWQPLLQNKRLAVTRACQMCMLLVV